MNTKPAQEQIARLKIQHCWDAIEASAGKHNLPLAFVCAICSRETNCDNILGDFRGGVYHGVGVMQIDIQHEIAREAIADRTWKEHPGPLIDFGCALLEADSMRAAAILGFEGADLMRFTAAAYNAGFGGALRGHHEGDCDRHTTGKNYGRDVMQRMLAFEKALALGPRPKRTVACR